MQGQARSTVIEQIVLSIKNNDTESMTETLLNETTPLVYHFAALLSGGRYNQDMLQSGFEGVLKALKSFNPEKGTSFVTYAGHYIMGEIRHYIRKETKYYKPRYIDGIQMKVQTEIEAYYEKNGEMPSKDHLAELFNINIGGINEILKAGLVSMDEIDIDKISCIRYESFKLPIEDKIVLYESIRKLSDLKQKLIYCLFFKNLTQQQTADYLGINQRKVSRLLKSSIDDLKDYMVH